MTAFLIIFIDEVSCTAFFSERWSIYTINKNLLLHKLFITIATGDFLIVVKAVIDGGVA